VQRKAQRFGKSKAASQQEVDMEFRNLPDGMPSQHEIQDLARRLHALGELALASFLDRLFANQMPTAFSIAVQLRRPEQFAVNDETGEAPRWEPWPRPLCRSEKPPQRWPKPAEDGAEAGQNPTSKRRLSRRQPMKP
jgi:hypothetical protein